MRENNRLNNLESKMESAIADIRETLKEYKEEMVASKESEVFSMRTHAFTDYYLAHCDVGMHDVERFKVYYRGDPSSESREFVKNISIRMNNYDAAESAAKRHIKELVGTFNHGWMTAKNDY